MTVLIFHRVTAQPDPLYPGEMHASAFDVLMAHVSRRFNVLGLSDALSRLERGSLPRRALAITFDDGYADNLTVAAPILRRYGLPATVFVATGYLDGGCMWNDIVIHACRTSTSEKLDLEFAGLGIRELGPVASRAPLVSDLLRKLKYLEFGQREAAARQVAAAAGASIPTDLMLTSANVVELVQSGVEIGAHTCKHPILAAISDAEAWKEIAEVRTDLRGIIGKPATLFAYPNGRLGDDYNETHAQMVKEAGYDAAFTTEYGAVTARSDRYQLPRFTPWRRSPSAFDLQIAQNLLRDPDPAVQPSQGNRAAS